MPLVPPPKQSCSGVSTSGMESLACLFELRRHAPARTNSPRRPHRLIVKRLAANARLLSSCIPATVEQSADQARLQMLCNRVLFARTVGRLANVFAVVSGLGLLGADRLHLGSWRYSATRTRGELGSWFVLETWHGYEVVGRRID
jgi:hypothetical protein